MSESVLIFDFDGTIADSLQYTVDICNRLADEFNYNKIDQEEVKKLQELSIREVLRYIGIPILKIPLIMAKGTREFQKSIAEIQPIAGMREVLLKLKELGRPMGIVSSNSVENIEKFLETQGLKVFDFIHGTSRLLKKHISLNHLMKEKKFTREKTIYIGDEVRDVVAARKARMKCAAVTWGYNSAEALEAEDAEYLLVKPEELLTLD